MSTISPVRDPDTGTSAGTTSEHSIETGTGAAVAPPIIQMTGVTKRYGAVVALDQVSLAIAPGESVALWGPNGAGKTTIIRCLLGLANYSGQVVVDTFDPARAGERARRRIGYVPQQLPVTPMTVADLVQYVGRLKQAPRNDGPDLLEQLGIAAQAAKPVGALSGGQRQRLALALALIGSPTILFLDEPTANLDARGRADLLQLLTWLRQEGMTVLFSSHRPEDILALADRVILLDGGRLIGERTPARFMRDLGETSRMVLYLPDGAAPEALTVLAQYRVSATPDGKVLTVSVQQHQKAEVLDLLARAGIELEDFDVERLIWT
jgi:ABC-type multidrug transport system ATPase subunit